MDNLNTHIQSPYSNQWESLVRLQDGDVQLRTVLRDIFARARNGVVVDVGAGQSDKMAKFFTRMGAAYIGVEPIPRNVSSQVAGAEFVEDDIVSFLQDRGRFRQFRDYPSRNFMFNGIDSIATSVPFDELSEMLIFYLNPGDYVFGIYAPELIETLRQKRDLYEEAYPLHGGTANFFAFRLKTPQKHKALGAKAR